MYLITSAISGTLGLIFLILWVLLSIFTLINIFRNDNVNRENKFLWVIIIVVVPILGSLVYLYWHSVKKPE
jgi:hypothetical protein